MNPYVMEVTDNAMSDVLRQKTEVERLRIAGRMWKSARVENSNFGGGFNTTTNIAVNPFTAGVNSIVYNLKNSIAGGTPLVRSDAASNSPVIVAFESFSAIPDPSAALLRGFCLCILTFRRVHRR